MCSVLTSSQAERQGARWVEVSGGNNCKICQSLKISWQTDWRQTDNQHGFVLFSHSRLGQFRERGWDIFNLSRQRFGVIFPLISGCWSGRILSGEAGRHLKEFLITVLLVRSSGEQYRDNGTDELRDIFHFDETKEEYFGTNIHQQLLTGPNLISSLIDAYLVQNIPILFSAG